MRSAKLLLDNKCEANARALVRRGGVVGKVGVVGKEGAGWMYLGVRVFGGRRSWMSLGGRRGRG